MLYEVITVAMSVRRRRPVPSGTVGGRIPWTNTPRSNKARDAAIVSPSDPTRIGTMAVSDSTLLPLAPISSRNNLSLSHRAFSRPGSRARIPSEASVAPATAGGSPVRNNFV